MNKHLGAVFLAIIDNRVSIIETNLLAFYKKLALQKVDISNYQALSRRFKKEDYFSLTSGEKTFFLQKVVNE